MIFLVGKFLTGHGINYKGIVKEYETCIAEKKEVGISNVNTRVSVKCNTNTASVQQAG